MEFLKKVHWLGHATVRVDAESVIYFDPWQVGDGPKADLILITHDHYDHCSPEDIARISKKGTVIVAPACCRGKLEAAFTEAAPGADIMVGKVRVKAVPAYNLDKKFHTKQSGGVGYLVTVSSVTLYHAGDTDAVPEMEGLAPDIAFLPVGGTYTMDAAQAAGAAKALRPKLVVPIHYGAIVGSLADAKKLERLSSVPVRIIPSERG